MSPEAQAAAQRLRLALDLFESGEAVMRQNLRRKFPEATEAEIEERLTNWLRHRPGAEQGDSSGKPIAWPIGSR